MFGRIWLLLIASLVASVLAFAGVGVTFGGLGGFVFHGRSFDNLFAGGLAFSVIWLVMLIAALIRYRWRGLWLLAGMPLALYWPTFLIQFALGMAETGKIP